MPTGVCLSPLCLLSAIKLCGCIQGVSLSEIADYIPVCDSSTHVCSVPHFSDFVFKSCHSSWTCHSLILPSSRFLAHLYYHSYNPLVCFSFAVLACTNPTLKKKINLDWGDDSVSKVLAIHGRAPEFSPWNSCKAGISSCLRLAFFLWLGEVSPKVHVFKTGHWGCVFPVVLGYPSDEWAVLPHASAMMYLQYCLSILLL